MAGPNYEKYGSRMARIGSATILMRPTAGTPRIKWPNLEDLTAGKGPAKRASS
jgi:hypothetical protein